MRLITRADFDGLTSAVLLKEVEPIDEVLFVHPKDVQARKVKVGPNDILANLPYHPKCGMWFDHHASEATRGDLSKITFKGRFAVAPSAARVVYDHYTEQGQGAKLKKYGKLLEAVDRSDSADLTMRDVKSPKGWVLLSLLVDPRTGLGYREDYAISNMDLMRKIVDWIPQHKVADILELPDVKPRIETYFREQEAFKEVLKTHSRVEKNAVVTDLRGVKQQPAGNRFLIYTLFPGCNISVRIFDGKGRLSVIAVGHNIFDRSSKVHVGRLMARFGGGGHKGAGACQIPRAEGDATLRKVLTSIKRSG